MRIYQLITLCFLSTLLVCCDNDSEEALLAKKGIETATSTDTTDVLKLTFNQTNVKSIIDANCAIPFCHSAPENAGDISFESYASVAANGSKIINRINDTSDPMPPSDFEPLSQAQKDLIEQWVEDGSLEN